jgi:hypothetical protein
MPPNPAVEQQRSLSRAFHHAQLPVSQLWLRYFALGGTADPLDVDAYVHGLTELPAPQRDVLAHAMNERLDELAGELQDDATVVLARWTSPHVVIP